MFAAIEADAGSVNHWLHNRAPTPLDRQTVIRMNRDTLYSGAIVDISAGATLSIPDAGRRYMSVMVVNQDHYVNRVFHGPGQHDLTVEEFGTPYVLAAARVLVDPGNPDDIASVNAMQDQFGLRAGSARPFVPPDYDRPSFDATRAALLELATGLGDFGRSFGTRHDVDPVRHLIATAAAWGGYPNRSFYPVERGLGPSYPAGVSDRGFWAVQSLVTEPGPAAAAIDQLPSDLGALRAASQQLVFHYWADGDYAANGIEPERISEIDTRYAAAMFARLGELADLPLSAAREPRQRLVGCCRDFTVLFVAMARHKGIPCRARVGFARYFFDGWLIDHEIAEVWDGSAERWRLVEPEIDDGHTDPADGASFDALDVPPDRFLTAPRAWQLARSGAVDPERFVVAPDLEIPTTRGWPQLRRSLVRDLAALNKTEMLLWEDWGLQVSRTPPGPDELPVLDELAALTGQPSPPLADLRSAYRRPEFVVPDTVTTYSPARTDVPAVVDVSAVARAAG